MPLADSSRNQPRLVFRGRARRLPAHLLLVTIFVAVLWVSIGSPSRADAAERGTGFGTWAPISAYGWHGSMLVGGVHT